MKRYSFACLFLLPLITHSMQNKPCKLLTAIKAGDYDTCEEILDRQELLTRAADPNQLRRAGLPTDDDEIHQLLAATNHLLTVEKQAKRSCFNRTTLAQAGLPSFFSAIGSCVNISLIVAPFVTQDPKILAILGTLATLFNGGGTFAHGKRLVTNQPARDKHARAVAIQSLVTKRYRPVEFEEVVGESV